MKTVKLTDPKIEGDFKGKRLTDDDFVVCFDESVKIVGPNSEPIGTFLKQAIPMEEISKAWGAIRGWNPKTDNRGTATGIEMVHRKKKDGTISRANRVPKGYEVVSGVMGFFDRYPRIPYCRACAWNDEHPEKYEAMLPLMQKVSELHKQYEPESYAHQMEFVEKTHKDFVIPGTIYTTVTVNKNFRTASHLDAKNLRDGMAAMAMIREGKIKGGLVVLPEFKVAFKMDTGDVIFFRNMKDYHGNTPILRMTKNAQRCTLVHYYREGMIKCGSMEQEIERAKRRQPGDPIMNDSLNPEAKDML